MKGGDCVVEVDVNQKYSGFGKYTGELFPESTTNIRHHIREQMVFSSGDFGGQNFYAQQGEKNGNGPDD